jgi:hypothetical protein
MLLLMPLQGVAQVCRLLQGCSLTPADAISLVALAEDMGVTFDPPLRQSLHGLVQY